MALKLSDVIPETGEWVLSVKPGKFIITLLNDTPFLRDYSRIALFAEVGDCVGASENPNMAKYQLKIKALHEVDGVNPGPEIQFSDEGQSFCQSVIQRLADSLNKWDTTTSQEDKEEIWAMGDEGSKSIILEVLEQLFGKRKE